jgi:hypothetical protein
MRFRGAVGVMGIVLLLVMAWSFETHLLETLKTFVIAPARELIAENDIFRLDPHPLKGIGDIILNAPIYLVAFSLFLVVTAFELSDFKGRRPVAFAILAIAVVCFVAWVDLSDPLVVERLPDPWPIRIKILSAMLAIQCGVVGILPARRPR